MWSHKSFSKRQQYSLGTSSSCGCTASNPACCSNILESNKIYPMCLNTYYPKGETQMEFQGADFQLTQTWLLWTCGCSDTVRGRVSISITDSNLFFLFTLFIWKAELQIKTERGGKRRERALPKSIQHPSSGESKSRVKGFHLGLPTTWQNPKHLGHHLVYFRNMNRNLGWKLSSLDSSWQDDAVVNHGVYINALHSATH